MIKITYREKTQTLSEWAKETKIDETTIRNRIERGWSAEKALTTPPRQVFAQNKNKPSKNEIEMLLNDLPADKRPPELVAIIPNYSKSRFGTQLRDNFRAQFDSWYNKTYVT